MHIAIIPARLASKRVPKKNIKSFYGKPIISYPISKILKSSIFDKIFVSTESKEIARIAIKYGAQVPFLRDKRLSDDFTPTIPVINNFITELDNRDIIPKKKILSVCCVYPANPFLQIKDLKKAYKIYNTKKYDYVFTAAEYSHPIDRAFYKKGNKSFYPNSNNIKKRTQDLNRYFHDAGQFYIGQVSSWINEKKIFSNKSEFIEINKLNYCDIDYKEDWDFALKLYKSKYK